MTFRRLLNVVYASLVNERREVFRENPARMIESLEAFDRQLNAPFDHEMTPEERRREEARRMAEASGAISGQDALMRSMPQQALEAFKRQQAQQAMGKA